MNASPARRKIFAVSLAVIGWLALAGPFVANAQTGDAVRITGRAVRVTGRTGVVTLLPRQTLRLHLVDAGTSAAQPILVVIELRDDRGNLLFSTSPARTVRPNAPLNVVIASSTLLGSSSFRYIRAQVQIDTDLDNLASVPMFSLEIQNSLGFVSEVLLCGLPARTDPVGTIDPVQPQPPVDPAAPPPVPLLESPYEPGLAGGVTEITISGDCHVVRTTTP